jgi:hypothetical protein
VQHAHHSPYRYVPGDPALSSLRQPNQELFDNINRRDYARTIYPPIAQMLFYLITFINPTMTFMKLAMILFEGITVYALVQLLRKMGLRREQSLLYAWCPLLVWEIGSSGHVDSVAIAFMMLALLARYRSRPALTGLFLGLAVMTKIYPLALFPALYRRGDYKMPAAMIAVIALGYACYSGVGLYVFGYLGDYVQEEGIQTGARYFLLQLAQRVPALNDLPTFAYLCFSVIVLSALCVWCWRTCCDPAWQSDANRWVHRLALPSEAEFLLPALVIALSLMLLFSPHYPWYIAWLVPFFALIPNLTLLAYLNIFFYMCTTALAVGSGEPQFRLNEIVYTVVLAGFLLDCALLRWPVRSAYFRPQLELHRQGSSAECNHPSRTSATAECP